MTDQAIHRATADHWAAAKEYAQGVSTLSARQRGRRYQELRAPHPIARHAMRPRTFITLSKAGHYTVTIIAEWDPYAQAWTRTRWVPRPPKVPQRLIDEVVAHMSFEERA